MIKGKYARKGRDPHGGRAGEPGRRGSGWTRNALDIGMPSGRSGQIRRT